MFIIKNHLPSPLSIQKQFPLEPEEQTFIANSRLQAKGIVEKKIPRFAVLVGPCSIHDPESAIEYALRLKKLSYDVGRSLFLVMRFFMEKPRTQLGWKGLLYDPHLDGSYDIAEGIRRSRELLIKMAKLRIPCACELLDPLAFPYFSDLISWGFIGARTAASTIHRQLASGACFPIGFKNTVHGEIDVAILGALTAKHPHSHIGINEEGQICTIQTSGNPWTHLVLRGSYRHTNFHPHLVSQAAKSLQAHHLTPRIVIDCAHGNSKKHPARQKEGFESAIFQAAKQKTPLIGIMLESHLFQGKQKFPQSRQNLLYGISLTDPCLGWEETEKWLLWADTVLSTSN